MDFFLSFSILQAVSSVTERNNHLTVCLMAAKLPQWRSDKTEIQKRIWLRSDLRDMSNQNRYFCCSFGWQCIPTALSVNNFWLRNYWVITKICRAGTCCLPWKGRTFPWTPRTGSSPVVQAWLHWRRLLQCWLFFAHYTMEKSVDRIWFFFSKTGLGSQYYFD